VALGSHLPRFVPEDDTIGAGSQTDLAASALVGVQYHHTVISLVDSGGRAGVHAGWFLAVHTGERQVVHGKLRKLALGGISRLTITHYHPYPRARLNTVFYLAGYRAGMTADASL